jgi:hypothetical protein
VHVQTGRPVSKPEVSGGVIEAGVKGQDRGRPRVLGRDQDAAVGQPQVRARSTPREPHGRIGRDRDLPPPSKGRAMQFMVIERFGKGARPVYDRFERDGRLMRAG